MDENIEFDYGDVLALRALLKGLLANTNIEKAYNLNADIDVEVNDTDNSVQEFLARNTSFLTLTVTGSSYLSTAKTWLSGALDDMTNAINTINNENENQNDDLVTLEDMTPEEITQALADIEDAKASLNGSTQMGDNDSEVGNEFTLNMSAFFAGLPIGDLLPPFVGDTPGMFPDVTLGGILPNAPTGININED